MFFQFLRSLAHNSATCIENKTNHDIKSRGDEHHPPGLLFRSFILHLSPVLKKKNLKNRPNRSQPCDQKYFDREMYYNVIRAAPRAAVRRPTAQSVSRIRYRVTVAIFHVVASSDRFTKMYIPTTAVARLGWIRRRESTNRSRVDRTAIGSVAFK